MKQPDQGIKLLHIEFIGGQLWCKLLSKASCMQIHIVLKGTLLKSMKI